MSILSSQLVWMLISYLATKIASKTWGRIVLKIGAGYLAARAGARSDTNVTRIEQTRPLSDEERARLSDADRRTINHDQPGAGSA